MPCTNLTEPLKIYVSRPNGRVMTRTRTPPVGLKVEAAMASADDQYRIGLPPDDTQLSTRNARLWTQEIQPNWRSEQTYDLQTKSPG